MQSPGAWDNFFVLINRKQTQLPTHKHTQKTLKNIQGIQQNKKTLNCLQTHRELAKRNNFQK